MVSQNKAVNGDDSEWQGGDTSSNGVELASAAADTPESWERASTDGTATESFQFPPRDDVELLRVQLRNETRRVRHLEELLQHRFSDVGSIREVDDTHHHTLHRWHTYHPTR